MLCRPWVWWVLRSRGRRRSGVRALPSLRIRTGAGRSPLYSFLLQVEQFGEHAELSCALKPGEADSQIVGPDIIWSRRHRLEDFDEAHVRRSRKQPRCYGIAKISPAPGGRMHIHGENIEVAETIGPGFYCYGLSCRYPVDAVPGSVFVAVFSPVRVFCTSTTKRDPFS